MNGFQRWWQAPQTHWLRRLLFQVHLWLGVGLGLYVLVISLSGSALLLKSPFYGWFEPKRLVPLEVAPLEGDALTARMAEVYAGYELGFSVPGFEPDDATYIVLQKDGEYFPYYFNQYTGDSIGPANPWPIKTVEWLADIHDDLLLGSGGRQLNGIGGLLFVLMSATGLLIWWQGRTSWYEGLFIWPGPRRSLLWQLHSCLGFWALLLMLAWGVSGFQLGFPRQLNMLVDWLDPDLTDFERPDSWLRFFRTLHFARIGQGPQALWVWIVLSFIPTLMFVTGVWLWWRRVVLRRRQP